MVVSSVNFKQKHENSNLYLNLNLFLFRMNTFSNDFRLSHEYLEKKKKPICALSQTCESCSFPKRYAVYYTTYVFVFSCIQTNEINKTKENDFIYNISFHFLFLVIILFDHIVMRIYFQSIYWCSYHFNSFIIWQRSNSANSLLLSPFHSHFHSSILVIYSVCSFVCWHCSCSVQQQHWRNIVWMFRYEVVPDLIVFFATMCFAHVFSCKSKQKLNDSVCIFVFVHYWNFLY